MQCLFIRMLAVISVERLAFQGIAITVLNASMLTARMDSTHANNAIKD